MNQLSLLQEVIRPHHIYHRGWAMICSSVLPIPVRASRYECEQGTFWPLNALTMVGTLRLNALQDDIRQLQCSGDVIECGVWRGGCLAWMRGCLDSYGQRERRVIGFDTFAGFDRSQLHWKDWPTGIRGLVPNLLFNLFPSRFKYLCVSRHQVLATLIRLGLNDHIELIEGHVQETLPKSGITQVALARIDVDLYDPVKACLEFIWPRVSVGGVIHIDDYHACPGCKQASDAYRANHQSEITETEIDSVSIRWTKKP